MLFGGVAVEGMPPSFRRLEKKSLRQCTEKVVFSVIGRGRSAAARLEPMKIRGIPIRRFASWVAGLLAFLSFECRPGRFWAREPQASYFFWEIGLEFSLFGVAGPLGNEKPWGMLSMAFLY